MLFRDEQRTGRDRRAEPRYRINEPAILKTEVGGIAAVRIIDISAIGLRITAPGPIPVNTEVDIQFDGLKRPGFVKNCRCIRATEFHVGIITAPPAGSEEKLPMRLDDLRLLRRAKLMNRGMPIDRRAAALRRSA